MTARRRLRSWWVLAVAMAAVSVVLLGLLAYLVERRATETVRGEARERLAGTARLTALFLDEQLRGIEDLVESYARRPEVLEALTGSQGVDSAALDRHMHELRDARADVLNVAGVADLSGLMVGGTVTQPPGVNFSDRDWHQAVRRTQRVYVSDALAGRSPGQPLAVSVAAPVYDIDQRLVAIIVVGYTLERLQEFVQTFTAERTAEVTVTDRAGVVIAQPGLVPTALVSRTDHAGVAGALAGRSGVTDDGRNTAGDRMLSAYTPVPRLGWTVTAELPHRVAYAGIRALREQTALVTVPLALLFALGSVLVARSVRARDAAEQEQRRVSEQLATVIDISPVPTAITRIADGTILFANAAMLRTLGWDADEMVGRTTAEIDLWANPENRQVMVDRLARDGHIYQMEERLRRSDGTVLDVITSIEVVEFDGERCLLGLFYDISDRVGAEARLRASQAQLRAFLDHLPAPASLRDVDGRLLVINESAARAYGRTSEELVGRELYDFMPRDLADELLAGDREVLESRRPREEEGEHRDATGAKRFALHVRFPVIDGDRTLGVGGITTDLTERRRLEQEAREAADRVQLLLHSTSEGIFGIDFEGRFTFVNPAAAEAFGSAGDELVGEFVHGLVHHHRPTGEVYPWQECPTYRTLATGNGVRVDQELFFRRDGTSFPVSYSSEPLRREDRVVGAVVVFSDITQRIESEKALRVYRALFEHSLDGVIFTARDGTVYSANPAACELLRMSEEEIRRRGRAGLADPTDVRWRTGAEERARHDNFRGELRMLRGDGSSFEADISAATFRDETGEERASLIFRDVSNRVALIEDRARAAAAAAEASRLKSEFLANMSHEIRTPMNGVLGLTGLLLGTDLDARQRRYAEAVNTAAEALLGVINDILDFSKIEAGKLEVEVVDFDLRQVVEEAADLLAGPAQRKGLELVGYCDPRLPTALRGDPGRVRQVLINLMSNAVKFTEQGEVVVRARPGHAPANSENVVPVHFEVVDTGIGIEPADASRLFEPFAQADASTTRRYGGTGLGLAISAELVRAMGGELGVESRPGEGSRFWFALALERQPDAPAGRRAQAHRLQGRRVLIVDDNETNRLILCEQLRAWQLHPDAVGDGPSALERLGEAVDQAAPYELALLDLCMEPIDGLEVARRVSADPRLAGTRMVLLSSAADVDTAAAAGAGLAAKLTKPVRQSQLYDTLMQVMGPEREAVVARERPAPPRAGPSQGHILVVEDNPTNQMVATGILEELHYTSDVVGNGREALAALERGGYVAVLMDCQMPEMDGYQATAEIRRREGDARHIPIIAMTAAAMEGDRERCLAAGMDDYVSKPVDPRDLEAALERRVIQPAPAAATESTTDSALAPLDPVRLELLRRMRGGDGGMLRLVAEGFLAQAPADLVAIDDAIAGGRLDAAEQVAHRLRGAAANLGAITMAATSAQIEDLAGAGTLDTNTGRELVSVLRAEFARVAEALATTVAQGAP